MALASSQDKPLKYMGYAIVCQEVPDEISLAVNVSGCPYHCEGCHSQYLWEYQGEYLGQDLKEILDRYKDSITCICFMGGDQNIGELLQHCRAAKSEYGLKTCIYTGCDSVEKFTSFFKNRCLDYLKIGMYVESKGGLDSESSNQAMYKVAYKDGGWDLIDITACFHKKAGYG